jgi:ketosteroid isomerase-like protein
LTPIPTLASHEQALRALYRAFNHRDIEAVLAAMSDDVDWPNAWEGGRIHGKDAIRAYWTRQWQEIDPHVEPISITAARPDGDVAVDVHQVVRAPSMAICLPTAGSCTCTGSSRVSSPGWT